MTAQYWQVVSSSPVGSLFYGGPNAKMECADAHAVLWDGSAKLLLHIECKNYGPNSQLDFGALMEKTARNCDEFRRIDPDMQHLLLVVCPKYAPTKAFGQKKTGDYLRGTEKVDDLTRPVDMSMDEWLMKLKELRPELATSEAAKHTEASKLQFSFHYCALDRAAIENLGLDIFATHLQSD